MAVLLIWFGGVLLDRRTLDEKLIRMHVVANSDREEDQMIKLLVRDAVLESIQEDLNTIADTSEAKKYLEHAIPKIEKIANSVLDRAGIDMNAVVTLCRESFDTRCYETFSLPAGVYESLRIVIGEGKGHNWWCVAFPSLCIPTTEDTFVSTAVGAGFSSTLTDSLKREGREIRFFFLDKLGQLENILFEG